MKSFYHNTRPFYHNTRPFYHNTLLKAIILSPIPTNTDQYSSKSKDILAFRLVKISRFHHRHFGIAYKVLTQIYFCFGSLFSICRNHTVCLKDLQSNISRFHYQRFGIAYKVLTQFYFLKSRIFMKSFYHLKANISLLLDL